PIFSVHDNPQAGLRAVCMPYFGGASLSRVLQALWAESDLPTRGEQLVQALAAVGGPWPAIGRGSRIEDRGSKPTEEDETKEGFNPASPTLDPRSSILDPRSSPWAGLDYTRAAVWIAARLAEGLEHAHERGVQHRDVKPSNILVGADGQPMLLDF